MTHRVLFIEEEEEEEEEEVEEGKQKGSSEAAFIQNTLYLAATRHAAIKVRCSLLTREQNTEKVDRNGPKFLQL